MVGTPQLPLKYRRKAGPTPLEERAFRSCAEQLTAAYHSVLVSTSSCDHDVPQSPGLCFSSPACSSPTRAMYTPEPPSSPIADAYVLSSPSRSFWDVAFDYGAPSTLNANSLKQHYDTHAKGDEVPMFPRRRSSSYSAPTLVPDIDPSEYSEDLDLALMSDDMPESPKQSQRRTAVKISDLVDPEDKDPMLVLHPKEQEQPTKSSSNSDIDIATALLDLSRGIRISSKDVGRDSYPPTILQERSDVPPDSETTPKPVSIDVDGVKISHEEMQIFRPMKEDCEPILRPLTPDVELPVHILSIGVEGLEALPSRYTQETETNTEPLRRDSTPDSPSVAETSGTVSLAVEYLAPVATPSDLSRSTPEKADADEDSSTPPTIETDTSEDAVIAFADNDSVFSSTLTSISSGPSPERVLPELPEVDVVIAQAVISIEETSRGPCEAGAPLSSMVDAHKSADMLCRSRSNSQSSMMSVAAGPSRIRSPSPTNAQSADSVEFPAAYHSEIASDDEYVHEGVSVLSTSRKANKTDGQRGRKPAKAAPDKMKRAREASATRASPASTTLAQDELTIKPSRKKKRKSQPLPVEHPDNSAVLDSPPEPEEAQADAPSISPQNPDTHSEKKAELLGLLIQTMALSRASSMPASCLLREILREQPHFVSQMSKEAWLRLIEEVLIGHDAFGRIDREGLDAADKPLEAQWFYVPENDPDQDRASLLKEMMPKKRQETKKHKQYYYRPLGKMTRWDAEDDM